MICGQINYEKTQVNRIRGKKIKVKIISDNGETNWISLMPKTFEVLKEVITRQGNE